MQFEIQAHRGARAFFPENTIPAFCKAVDLGCPVIELDLVASQDRRIIVAHDPWLHGTPGVDSSRRNLFQMSWAQISRFDCGLPNPAFPSQQRIVAVRPLLAEVFRELEAHLERVGRPGGLVYNLEVKSRPGQEGLLFPPPEEYARLVVEEIHAAGMQARVRLQSFDSRIVAEAHRIASGLCFGLLAEAQSELDAFPASTGFVPAYVNPHHRLVDEALVGRLHGYGCKVVAWTVNDPDGMVRMRRLGVDGIITDHPEVALAMPELR